MATCKKISVVPVPLPAEYELRLDAAEVRVLMALFAKIGGPPSGFRGVMDGIQSSLCTAAPELDWDQGGKRSREYTEASGSIYFNSAVRS